MSMHYRIAEKLLYTYPINVMRHQEAMLKYMRIKGETDCHAQRYTSEGEPTSPSDPPSDYVNRLLKAEQDIRKYSERTRAIREVRYELRMSDDTRSGIMLQVMELVYFEGMSMRDLAMHLGMNERTLYRRREELVHEVMKKRSKLPEVSKI